MKRPLIYILCLFCLAAAAQVSYWFSGWQRQGNAQYAQRYFLTNLDGTITFAFDGTRSVISAVGGGGGGILDHNVATLANGRVTVASASSSATRTILLTYISTDGVHFSTVAVRNIVPGVSFDIAGGADGDNNKVSWCILGP